ncbi:hypothetical protein CRUP_033715 [Coryphaenoides rupestris]|nr:hypothetical protein CRUP_033715 [Coryphaenoides rupestris]
MSSWGPWSACSLSCGGLGLKTRSRGCTQPAPAHGGRDCQGPQQETTYCQAPDCPAWSVCSRTCSDTRSPATKTRQRRCIRPPCSGTAHQQKACNLPQCPDGGEVCMGEACVSKNCSWTEWGEWGSCSRSCGVGQQLRLRTFLSPGPNGSWCPDILEGNQEQRFCNIRPCRVDGGWSRWSPWSRCDKRCGGGRSIRTRSCSSPPPKNGDEKSCPPGQSFVSCANQCPQRCSDLQQGIECHGNAECQPGCSCPKALGGGVLTQAAVTALWQCDCIDSLGQTWAAGSSHQVACNKCSCSDGLLLCTNHSCEDACTWSSWSNWAPCSTSCGRGQRTRYRSLIPETPGANCQFEEVQHKPCDPGPCPLLCLHDDQELRVGNTWLQGECKQCCGAGSAWRRRWCMCEEEGDAACPPEVEVERGREETQLCYKQPCPGCPMSEWSEWSECSCVSQRRQRHRVALSPATRGQQCSPVETQSRPCNLSHCDSCDAPFVFSECGAPCEKQCALRGLAELCVGVSECTPGCYCPQGLLLQNGNTNGCVPPEDCGCVHLQQHSSDQPPTPITVPQGETLIVGCSTCLCHDGTLQCDMRECEGPALVSLQRRYRACLDLDSGLPISDEEEQSQCSGPLTEERACPDPTICRGN